MKERTKERKREAQIESRRKENDTYTEGEKEMER